MSTSLMNPTTKKENVITEIVKTDNPLTQLTNDYRLPIDIYNENIKNYELEDNEIKKRDTLIEDLRNAQKFTVNALYHFIQFGNKLNGIKDTLDKGRFIPFLKSIGINERTAQRYMKIAKEKRFLNMSEKELTKTFHLTQTKMIKMIKFDDKTFNEALTNENFDFNPNEKDNNPKTPKGMTISNEKYETFKKESKDYVINEYDELYKKYLKLEKELNTLNTNQKDS